MAEVQLNTNSGETAAQFIEFVMMTAQNASLFLGLIPHPGNGEPEVNLPLARMFIDQLAMIQEKTRGNLSGEETNVLRNALSNLQMAYVEVAQQGGVAKSPAKSPEFAPSEPALAAPPASAAPPAGTPPPTDPAEENRESKKRFTKSYGS